MIHSKKNTYFHHFLFAILSLAFAVFVLSPGISQAATCDESFDPECTTTGGDWDPSSIGTHGAVQDSSLLGSIAGMLLPDVEEILFMFVQLFGWLLSVAAQMFSFAIDPDIFTEVFSDIERNNILYTAWSFVRDILNIVFIFSLLFAAFATVFHVSRFHIKNVLLTVIIMALLVNFSWPVARAIIDMGNILMYFAIDIGFPSNGPNPLTGEQIIGQIIDITSIDHAVTTNSVTPTYLVATMILMFTLALTLITLACLFVIRVAVLVLLLVTSAIGFVGFVLPSTAGQASRWWKMILQQSFFPMICIVILAIGRSVGARIDSSLLSPNVRMTDLITGFTLQVVFIWFAMTAGKSLGAVGAGLVVGKAQGFARGAFNKVRRGTLRGGIGVARMADMTSARAQRSVGLGLRKATGGRLGWDRGISAEMATRSGYQKMKNLPKRIREDQEALISGVGAQEKLRIKRAGERQKKLEESGMSANLAATALAKLNTKDKLSESEEAERMALNKIIGKTRGAVDDTKSIGAAVDSFGSDMVKVKKFLADAVSDDTLKNLDAAKFATLDSSVTNASAKVELRKRMIKGDAMTAALEHDLGNGGKSADDVYNQYFAQLGHGDLAKQSAAIAKLNELAVNNANATSVLHKIQPTEPDAEQSLKKELFAKGSYNQFRSAGVV